MLHDEPPTAVAALDRHELLFNALEQFKIQKGSQRCETIGLTEYGTFFRVKKCVSHAHTAALYKIESKLVCYLFDTSSEVGGVFSVLIVAENFLAVEVIIVKRSQLVQIFCDIHFLMGHRRTLCVDKVFVVVVGIKF